MCSTGSGSLTGVQIPGLWCRLKNLTVSVIVRSSDFLTEFQHFGTQCLDFLTRSLNIEQHTDRTQKQRVCGSEGQKPPSDKRKVKTKGAFGLRPREGCTRQKAPASLPPVRWGPAAYATDMNAHALLILHTIGLYI